MNQILVILAVMMVAMASQTSSHRHHHHHPHHVTPAVAETKVTNLTKSDEALRPSASPKDALTVTKRRYLRQDWCQSQPLIQRIGQPGCLSTTILNRFCYGQCNSFFIPKNQLKGESGSAFKSCAVCQPKRTSWASVTLKCPSLIPPIRRRRVQIIHQCRCMQQQDASPSITNAN